MLNVFMSRTTKYIKAKKEISDSYEVCKAKLVFTDEKDPEANYDIEFTENF